MVVTRKLCSVAECSQFSQAKGFCRKHWYRASKGLPLDAPLEDLRRKKRQDPYCSVDDCGRETIALNLCSRHYYAQRNKRDRANNPDRYLGYHLRRYGMSIDDYKDLLKKQDEACAICRTPAQDRRLAVDHDHATGEVRGLLCNNCNGGLGQFKDNLDNLLAAVRYLGLSDD